MTSYSSISAAALPSTANPDDPFGFYGEPESLPPEEDIDQGDDATLLPSFITHPATIVAKEGESTILDCAAENSGTLILLFAKIKNLFNLIVLYFLREIL